jgi:5-methylcytosine-specific restriction endonuclease McrA
MNTVTNILAQMSESELLDHFENLVERDRRTTTQLLVAIAEIDERKLWAGHAFPSMFAFCVERFHMSEQVTAKRIWAARTARRFPIVLEMVERGELHLSAIHLLARHLTADNCDDVLQRARHKSSREIEKLVAALAPRPDVASRVRALPRTVVDAANGVAAAVASGDATTRKVLDTAEGVAAAATSGDATTHSEPDSAAVAGMGSRPVQARGGSPLPAAAARPITALSPRRYKIEITIDEETHDKLRSLQDLLGRSQVGRDPAAIISRAIDSLLVDTLKRKAATTDRPRQACDASATISRLRPARAVAATSDVSHPASEVSGTTDRPQPAMPACEASPRTPQPRTRNIPARPASHASPKTQQPKTRTIPAALRRAVWQRDCGRCRYVDGRGRRCKATSSVEFHHKHPFAKGGRHDADNVELRCAAHNQYQADLDFGRNFMDGRRSAGAPS